VLRCRRGSQAPRVALRKNRATGQGDLISGAALRRGGCRGCPACRLLLPACAPIHVITISVSIADATRRACALPFVASHRACSCSTRSCACTASTRTTPARSPPRSATSAPSSASSTSPCSSSITRARMVAPAAKPASRSGAAATSRLGRLEPLSPAPATRSELRAELHVRNEAQRPGHRARGNGRTAPERAPRSLVPAKGVDRTFQRDPICRAHYCINRGCSARSMDPAQPRTPPAATGRLRPCRFGTLPARPGEVFGGSQRGCTRFAWLGYGSAPPGNGCRPPPPPPPHVRPARTLVLIFMLSSCLTECLRVVPLAPGIGASHPRC
jgi:hypothetical protein